MNNSTLLWTPVVLFLHLSTTDRNRNQLSFNMRLNSQYIIPFYLASQKGLPHQSRYVLHLVNMPQHRSASAACYAFLKWVVTMWKTELKVGFYSCYHCILGTSFISVEIDTWKIFSSCCSFFQIKSYPVAFTYNWNAVTRKISGLPSIVRRNQISNVACLR